MDARPPRRGIGVLILVGALLVLVDQLTKAGVRSTIAPGDAIPVIPGFLDLVHGQNTGIAFGLFRGYPALFTVFGLITIPLLLWGYFALPLTAGGRVAWAAIFGGAIGNQIDRLTIGYVTDFVDCYIGSYHWYAFNVADASIVVGVFALMFLNLTISPAVPTNADVPRTVQDR